MSNIPPPPPSDGPFMGGFSGESAVTPAPLGRRFGAFLLDILLTIVTCGIGWLVWAIILFQQGTSPAKKMLGLYVVDSRTGELASFGQMALREVIGKFVLGTISSGLTSLVGAIMIAVSPSRAGLWDMIARTTVVDRR